MILVKTWLERDSKFFIVSILGGVSGVLVDLMFFCICSMCTFFVAMDGGILFIRSTVRLVHVEKWIFWWLGGGFCRKG